MIPPAWRAAATALFLAAAASPLAAHAQVYGDASVQQDESLLGAWTLHCCGNSYLWRMDITEDDGVTFKGQLTNLKYNGPDGDISGRRLPGGRIQFDRTVPGGGQRWTGDLHGRGLARSMTGRWTGTGSDMGASLDFHAERPNAGVAPPLSGPGAPIAEGQSLAGDWILHCCGDSYIWTMTVTDDNGVEFRGGLVNLKTRQPDGVIAGRRIGGGAVEFDRTGPWGAQHWTAYLNGVGAGQRMIGGHWSGTGSDMGVALDFHAERPGRVAAGPLSGSSTAAPIGAGPSSGPAEILSEVWNTEGCGLTGTSVMTLSRPARLDQVQLWYNWRAGEASVAYALTGGGRVIARGELHRGRCDAYQASWCAAEATVGADLGAGDYQVEVAAPRVCQNGASQGRGFIKALGRLR